jgi:peptidoglycan/xylan/chitin deacetylase (PgdA/CDA1 family)
MASFRPDRFLTLLLFRSCRSRLLRSRGKSLPILMYHSVSEDSESTRSAYYQVVTTPRRFAEQMQWLDEMGYQGVSLEEALKPAQPITRPRAVITFDDGFKDFSTNAWPALQRHGFTATVYLPTGFIASEPQSFCGRKCLSWNEVRELRRAGVHFGSHTVSHPKLYQLGWDQIEDELKLSKQGLEQELGEEISSFAYPYAFPREDRKFTRILGEKLRRQGYRSCATTWIGRANLDPNTLFFPRLPVNAADDQALFSAKILGAYDWVQWPQYAVRWAGSRWKTPSSAKVWQRQLPLDAAVRAQAPRTTPPV